MRTFNDVSAIVCEAIVDKRSRGFALRKFGQTVALLQSNLSNVVKANEYLSG